METELDIKENLILSRLQMEEKEEFKKTEWEREMLDNIKRSYRKPLYDPFEIFHPTKTFIREVIKQLKETAYERIPSKHPLRNEAGFNELLLPELTGVHTAICKRIRDYEFRLRHFENGGAISNSIGQSDILRAKQYPIQDLYTGRLRKTGKTFFGLCPFHQEKSGSFYIYADNNKYTCFGCGEKGDSIDFVMKNQNLKFFDAVKFLIGK